MKGLTLIELMAAVAILTIILSVAVPGTSYLLEKYQADIAITALKSTLQRARSLAFKNELPITACPTHNSQCFNSWENDITVFHDANFNQRVDTNEHTFFSTKLNISTGYIQKKKADNPFILFNPMGHAFGSSTTFLYCPYSKNNSIARQLVISFQGRIRIGKYTTKNGTPYSSVAPLSCR